MTPHAVCVFCTTRTPKDSELEDDHEAAGDRLHVGGLEVGEPNKEFSWELWDLQQG